MRTGRDGGMAVRLAFATVALAAIAVASGCGSTEQAQISVDGSSTLAPFMEAAADSYESEGGLGVDVDISASGRGIERFCEGDIDIADTSRTIDEDEAEACAAAGIDYVALQVASDALTVAINRPILYDWVTCLTLEQLRKIWEPGSKVDNWREVDPSFPDLPLKLYANPDSGTFRFFTFVINGERGASRTDYLATDDHRETAEGVAGERGALGYFGFSFYRQNRDRLSALGIDGGHGCVEPSTETVHDGSYRPLARPLYIYVNQAALDESRPLRSFVRYILENARPIADEALFVPLIESQRRTQMQKFVDAISS
jgi:phosphate transport system substrate-binding protein